MSQCRTVDGSSERPQVVMQAYTLEHRTLSVEEHTLSRPQFKFPYAEYHLAAVFLHVSRTGTYLATLWPVSPFRMYLSSAEYPRLCLVERRAVRRPQLRSVYRNVLAESNSFLYQPRVNCAADKCPVRTVYAGLQRYRFSRG